MEVKEHSWSFHSLQELLLSSWTSVILNEFIAKQSFYSLCNIKARSSRLRPQGLKHVEDTWHVSICRKQWISCLWSVLRKWMRTEWVQTAVLHSFTPISPEISCSEAVFLILFTKTELKRTSFYGVTSTSPHLLSYLVTSVDRTATH